MEMQRKNAVCACLCLCLCIASKMILIPCILQSERAEQQQLWSLPFYFTPWIRGNLMLHACEGAHWESLSELESSRAHANLYKKCTWRPCLHKSWCKLLGEFSYIALKVAYFSLA